MRTFLLEREQFLPVDLSTTFGFFADAANLEALTPPWLHFEILSALPLRMHEGALIDYRLRLHGLPVRWQSEITVWQPNSRFVDEQRKGPYKLWVHEHRFEAIGDGTLVTDVVTYAVPGGPLVDRLFVRPDLERIFDYRRRRLTEWASARPGETEARPHSGPFN